jgi:hypothetical protein
MGQILTHSPQPMHLFALYNFCTLGEMLSGLWHQRHDNGQPFRKMVTRIPGPSLMA